jgi:hypothetical protein
LPFHLQPFCLFAISPTRHLAIPLLVKGCGSIFNLVLTAYPCAILGKALIQKCGIQLSGMWMWHWLGKILNYSGDVIWARLKPNGSTCRWNAIFCRRNGDKPFYYYKETRWWNMRLLKGFPCSFSIKRSGKKSEIPLFDLR